MRGSARAANSRGGVRAVTSRKSRGTRGRALDGRGGLREDSAPLAEGLLLLLLLFLAADAEGSHRPRLEALHGDLLLALSQMPNVPFSIRASALSILARRNFSRSRSRKIIDWVYSLEARSISSGRSSVSKLASSVSVFFAGEQQLPLRLLEHRLELLEVLLVQAPSPLTRPPGGPAEKSGETSLRPRLSSRARARAECGAASEHLRPVGRALQTAAGLQAEALLVRAAGACSRRMPDGKFDREFLRGALALTARSEVDRLLLVSDHPLSPDEIRGRPIKRKLVYAVTSEALANQLKAKKYTAVLIPPYDYTRIEKIKVAVVAAQSAGLVRDGDTILALSGPGQDRVVDTLVKVEIGSEDPEEKLRVDTLGLPAEFSSQVVESLIHTAMEIGAEGYEGHAGRHHPRHRRLDRGDGEEPPAHPEPVPGDQRGRAERARSAHPRGDQDVLRARRRLHHPRGRGGARGGPLPPHDVARREAADGARRAPQRRGVDHRGVEVHRHHGVADLRHRPRLPEGEIVLELRQKLRRV